MLKRLDSLGRAVFFGMTVCIMVARGVVTAGIPDSKRSEWHQRYKRQENAPQPEVVLLNGNTERDSSDGFQPLFNGKNPDRPDSQRRGTLVRGKRRCIGRRQKLGTLRSP